MNGKKFWDCVKVFSWRFMPNYIWIDTLFSDFAKQNQKKEYLFNRSLS